LKASLLFNSGIDPNNLNVLGNCNFDFPFTLENRYWYFGYWKDNVIAPGNFIKHGTITAAIPYRDFLARPLVFPALYGNETIGTPPRNNNVRIVNSTYTYPSQANPLQYGYGAFAFTAKVGHRWNIDDIIKTHSQVAVQPTITAHNRFAENAWIGIWDGTKNGIRVPVDVYLMVVSVSNCRVTDRELYRTYMTVP
jgi:hypothetical protein